MRTRTVAVLALALALGPAACARTGAKDPQVASAQTTKPKASVSAAPSNDPDAPLHFAKCMRDHGISWFPDPNAGATSIRIPQGQDRTKFEAAQEACKQYMPNGGNRPTPSAEELENARNMAKCMRANGIPNFPDPNPDGGMSIDPKKLGAAPGDSIWKKAEAACTQYMPKGAERHSEGGGSSGSGGTTNLGHAA